MCWRPCLISLSPFDASLAVYNVTQFKKVQIILSFLQIKYFTLAHMCCVCWFPRWDHLLSVCVLYCMFYLLWVCEKLIFSYCADWRRFWSDFCKILGNASGVPCFGGRPSSSLTSWQSHSSFKKEVKTVVICTFITISQGTHSALSQQFCSLCHCELNSFCKW